MPKLRTVVSIAATRKGVRIVVGTRNVYLAFIAIIMVVMLQSLASGLFGGGDADWLVGLLDPTGVSAVKDGVRQWTVEERNGRMIPFTTLLLANRGLWLVAGRCPGPWLVSLANVRL